MGVFIFYFIDFTFTKGAISVIIGGDVGMHTEYIIGFGPGGVQGMTGSLYGGVRGRWGHLNSVLTVLIWSPLWVTVPTIL